MYFNQRDIKSNTWHKIMISPKKFFTYLKKEDINFFAGVPDSLLKDLCFYISDHTTKKNHVIAANEGNALSLGIGYHLATKKIPMIYLQNSGLGNIINPLLSLSDPEVYSIPSLLVIGWRGKPGIKDEPQHKKQGRVMLKMLKVMEIPYEIISPKDTENKIIKILSKTIKSIRKGSRSMAIVVEKNTFEQYHHKKNLVKPYSMNREIALKQILSNIRKNDIVVATTGFTSRELYEYRVATTEIHYNDFLTVGGMGHANQIAMGIAAHKSRKNIYCLDGDGALLMHMGSLAINAGINCKNFKHIIFNNGSHESVGGQPTVGHRINFHKIAKEAGYGLVIIAKTYTQVLNGIKKMEAYREGASLMEVKISQGTRKDLGRPKHSPIENKILLMKNI